MEPLPLSFRDRGFLYEQIERQGDVALYSQTNHAGIVRYEVVRIRIQREHTWPNGTTTPEKAHSSGFSGDAPILSPYACSCNGLPSPCLLCTDSHLHGDETWARPPK
jgi:hypothetical protein